MVDITSTNTIILKMGGSAITEKDHFEQISRSNVNSIVEIIHKLVFNSKRPSRCVVVHGAGSFGHFQAKQYSVSGGWKNIEHTDTTSVINGFAKTRASVTKLNQLFIEKCTSMEIPVVSVSAFTGWRTSNRKVVQHNSAMITSLLDAGFVPVLHGDAVLDEELGCTILSGDTIIQVLAEHLRPKCVIYVSDVQGIYDKPPSIKDAKLIRTISVNVNGEINSKITTTKMEHDVTGGINKKLATACAMVMHNPTLCVYVCGVDVDNVTHIAESTTHPCNDAVTTIIHHENLSR